MVWLGAMHVRVGAVLGISAIVAAGLGIAPVTEEASAAPNLSPRTSTSGFTYVVDDTISLGISDAANDVLYLDNPSPADDSVYASVDAGGSRPDYVAAVNFNANDPSLTVDDTISFLSSFVTPWGMELGNDDTIYVALQDATRLAVINPRTNTLDDSVSTGVPTPSWVAVTGDDNARLDDTVYVVAGLGQSSLAIIDASPLQFGRTATYPGSSPVGTGITASTDDTVYVTGYAPTGTVWPMRDDTWVGGGSGLALPDIGIGPALLGDDTLFVPMFFQSYLAALNLRSNNVSSFGQSTPYFQTPQFSAYDPVYKRLYVSNTGTTPGFVTVVNLESSIPTFDDTIPVGAAPLGLAISADGTRVFVANSSSQSAFVSVIRVTPPTVTFNANGGSGSMTPQTSQVPANLTANAFTRAGYTFTGWNTAPGGNGTSYANQAQFPFNVTLTLYAQWQSDAPPPPPPVYPPGPPAQVTAVAGDVSAVVSWTAPSDSGSYPITDYQVLASPGGSTCQVKAPALTCQVTGLTNGTAYTFTARALNGAGWGAYSSPSNSVTPVAPPKPTIMITGSRDAADTRYVKVSGTTTDLVGRQVTPWVRFPGQSAFSAGTGVRTVNANGSFAWQRKTGKKIYVYFQHEDVKSNTVTISAR